jgi:glycosyltransferase involved in cell wall biosynthesis
MKHSVVMPVYNGERYLREALDSIFRQSFADFELVVVDDGSTDATVAILGDYAADPRLRLVRIAHGGIVAALNAGLRAARGEWIIRTDADDVMMEQRIERQIAFLAAHPELAGAGSHFHIIDEHGVQVGSDEPHLPDAAAVLARLRAGQKLIFPHPTMIFRRAAALAVGGYQEEYRGCEDVQLFLRMIESGHMLVMQAEHLMRLRYHSGSASARSTRAQTVLNEIIFSNYRRRAAGRPELDPLAYQQRIDREPLLRLLTAMRVRSEMCLRRRSTAKLRGRRLQAALLALAALALDPRKLVRQVAGRLAAA